MKLHTFYALLLAMLLLAACGGASPAADANQVGKSVAVAGGTYTDVSVAELQSMLAKKDFRFVNVHIPFDGNIASTDLSIPYNQIEQQIDQLPAEKDARIVLYCRTDRMSTIAAETLVKRGYTNVLNLDGGMVAWEQAGLPLESKQ